MKKTFAQRMIIRGKKALARMKSKVSKSLNVIHQSANIAKALTATILKILVIVSYANVLRRIKNLVKAFFRMAYLQKSILYTAS